MTTIHAHSYELDKFHEKDGERGHSSGLRLAQFCYFALRYPSRAFDIQDTVVKTIVSISTFSELRFYIFIRSLKYLSSAIARLCTI